MKKLARNIFMAGTLLLGSGFPLVARAADTVPTTPAPENRSASTSTNASFTANTAAMDPVDPSDPNTPSTTTGENAGKPAGGLSLIYAPMTLDFGAHEIDVMNNKSYNAKGESATLGSGLTPTFTTDTTGNVTWSTTTGATANQTTLYPGTNNVVLEVSDVRGTNAGWSLNVSSAGGTLSSIKGATITLPQGRVSSSGSVTSDTTNLAQAPNGATSSGKTIAIDGSSATVLGAGVNSGAGISADSLNPTGITLNVNANSTTKGSYTGALNWTLSDTALSNN